MAAVSSNLYTSWDIALAVLYVAGHFAGYVCCIRVAEVFKKQPKQSTHNNNEKENRIQ